MNQLPEYWEEIKYRWQNGQASLPGELAPIKTELGNVQVVRSIYFGRDRERVPILRRFRGLLGYGPGWTFVQALWWVLFPYIGAIAAGVFFAVGMLLGWLAIKIITL